jgi:hypothetical protein
MTNCEIDNNDTKLMQLSNDLNSYCVNESINSDNTDLVDLNNKCLKSCITGNEREIISRVFPGTPLNARYEQWNCEFNQW